MTVKRKKNFRYKKIFFFFTSHYFFGMVRSRRNNEARNKWVVPKDAETTILYSTLYSLLHPKSKVSKLEQKMWFLCILVHSAYRIYANVISKSSISQEINVIKLLFFNNALVKLKLTQPHTSFFTFYNDNVKKWQQTVTFFL